MSKWMTDIASFVVPPGSDDEKGIIRWRWAVFIVTSGTAAILAAHILMAKGLVMTGHAFATEVELENLSDKVSRMAEWQLDDYIMRLRERHCVAMITENREAASLAGERLRARTRAYRSVTGMEYPLPSCREAGVMNPP